MNLLSPVLGEEDETPEEFAVRMRAAYAADIASGAFEPVQVDFSTPTQRFPEACTGIADYTVLRKLIVDTKDACSFDAWLAEEIEKASAESIAAH